MPDSAEKPNPPQPEIVRHDNFERWYANHFQFQATDADLTILFGEWDVPNAEGKGVVQQHTAMTFTWEQAKVLAYFLDLYVAGRELLYGRITAPPGLWPTEPNAPTEEIKQQNPLAEAIYEMATKRRQQFIESIK
ncbi:MAG TPA: DUF3467 domain-containing protein [Terracidiphilus sp.]|nr:DUF3467 domain-containing protein [Terracidiphilus sp.]